MKTAPSVHRSARLAVLLASLVLSLSGVAAAPLRVVLDTFSSDDDSRRSALSAADFTAALQARLPAGAEFEFVERAELDRAAREFQLILSGAGDRATSLRRGRWLKADWALSGIVTTNSADTRRRLELELVDLDRAQLLGGTNIALGSVAAGPFAFTPADPDLAASVVAGFLHEQSVRRAAPDLRPSVALLFLWPEAGSPPIPGLADQLRSKLEADPSHPLRVVRQTRAGEAEGESSLVLSGLAESDPAIWLKVADCYVWGTCAVVPEQGQPQPGKRFNVSPHLFVWDGRGEPVAVTNRQPAAIPAGEVADVLARSLRPHLVRRAPGAPVDRVRQEVAATLLSAVEAELRTQRQLSLARPEDVARWLRLVQALETALFFDPANQQAREWRARLRWHGEAERAAKSEFVFARGAFAAWSDYLDRYGGRVVSTNYPSGFSRLAPEPVTKRWREAARQMLTLTWLVKGKGERGVPDDVDARTMNGWHGEIMRELGRRAPLLATDPGVEEDLPGLVYDFLEEQMLNQLLTPGERRSYLDAVEVLWTAGLRVPGDVAAMSPSEWPTLHYWLVKACARAGRPELAVRLKAALTDATRGFAAKQQPGPAPVAPTHRTAAVRLPRVTVLDESEGKTLLSVGGLDLTVPRAAIGASPVPFPAGEEIFTVRSLAAAGGKVWLAAHGREAQPVAAGEGTLGREIKARDGYATRLWSVGPTDTVARRVSGPLATNEVNDLLGLGDQLWSALAEEGVAALDTRSGNVRRFAEADGLRSGSHFRLAADAEGVFASGATLVRVDEGRGALVPVPVPGFMRPLAGIEMRLAGSGPRLAVANGGVLMRDGRDGPWARRDERLRSTLPPMTWLPIEAMAAGDGGEVWFGSVFGLHRVDATTGEARYWRATSWPTVTRPVPMPMRFRSPTQPPPSVVTNRMDHATPNAVNAAWQRRAAGPGKPVPWGRLPGGVTAVAADGGFVWVAATETSNARHSRICVLHAGSGRWVTSFTLPLETKALLVTSDTLWVGGRQSGSKAPALFQVAKAPLLATPKDRWVADAITADELAAAVSRLSPRSQAVVALFSGDAARVRDLLGGRPVEVENAEDLALLAAAHDGHGLAEPAAQRSLEDALLRRFPDSVFAARALGERGRAEVRARASARRAAGRVQAAPAEAPDPAVSAATLLGDYDTDTNGRLDETELVLAFELEPDRLPAAWPRIGGTPREEAAAALRRVVANPQWRAGFSTNDLASFFGQPPAPLPPPEVTLNLLLP